MPAKKKSSISPQLVSEQPVASSKHTMDSNLEMIARSVARQDAYASSAIYEADVDNVKRLLADHPELLDKLGTEDSSVRAGGAKSVAPALVSGQVVNMARLHVATQAGIASTDHLNKEIERYLSDPGIF